MTLSGLGSFKRNSSLSCSTLNSRKPLGCQKFTSSGASAESWSNQNLSVTSTQGDVPHRGQTLDHAVTQMRGDVVAIAIAIARRNLDFEGFVLVCALVCLAHSGHFSDLKDIELAAGVVVLPLRFAL
jgi:hypothetical protein